jgi:hypothetical protein
MRRLQPDHQVGLAKLRRYLLVHLRVQPKLVVAQIQARKDGVLLEQVVTHHGVGEHAGLRRSLSLLDPLKQERELGLESVARHVLVEAVEKGIFVRLLEQQIGTHVGSEPQSQRALADADRSLDRDVAKTPEAAVIGHRKPRSALKPPTARRAALPRSAAAGRSHRHR